MDCIVLTYEGKHRKTYDTLCLLKASGYNEVLVYAVPMHYKKTFIPIYEHRPKMEYDVSTDSVCANFGYKYVLSKQGYEELLQYSDTPILVCGAGILPETLIKTGRVINAHPGFIPCVRGLDALKWAIYEELPIGVTTHIIGNEVDAGAVIQRCEVPIMKNDTFHALAQRVYETEIKLLVESLKHYKDEHIVYEAGEYPLHKRMNRDKELKMMELFDSLVERRGI